MTHTSTEQPENVRDGAPYDNPAFEALARDMGVWGTAQSALCAQFWLASQAQRVPLALYQRDTIKANAWRETRDGGYWDVNAIIDGTERAHGITQEKQE